MLQQTTDPKHVLHVLAGHLLGGADRYALSVARGLKERFGYQASFALLSEGSGAEAARQAGFPTHVLEKRRRGDLRCADRLAEVAEKTGADLFHSHTFGTNFYTSLAKKRRASLAAVPIVETMHGFDFLRVDQAGRIPWRARLMLLQDRMTLSRVARVIVISDHAREVMLRLRYPADKLVVIHNAVSVPKDLEGVRDRGRNLRSSEGLDTLPLIGTVGRMVPVKSQKTLLEAVRRLKDTGLQVNAVFIGDGPLRADLEEAAGLLGIEAQVHFLGIRADALEWIAAMDVFCLPSLCEGIPLVLLEAMTVGTPIVASAAGGIPEIVENGFSGQLIAPGDPESLTQAVRERVDHPAESRAMSERAAEVVSKKFSFDRLLTGVAEVYESCWRGATGTDG